MYDDIVDFAELLDSWTKANYSSGMQVRWPFRLPLRPKAISWTGRSPTVGDESQRKCNDYFQERKKSGKTTILFTHDIGQIKKY